jgi:hypothetical protein
MLILRLQRWSYQPAWQDEDALPPQQQAALDDEGWLPPVLRGQTVAVSPHWCDDDTLPGAVLFFLDASDLALPGLLWQAWSPPPCSSSGVWVDDEILPLQPAALDEDGWQPPALRAPGRVWMPWQADGEVPPQPVTGLDDDGWAWWRPWELWIRPLDWGEDGDLPGAVSFVLDEDGEWSLAPWRGGGGPPPRGGGVGVQRGGGRPPPRGGEEDEQPPAAFVLDEAGWQPGRPWNADWRLLWWSEEDGVPAQALGLDEEAWRYWAPWPSGPATFLWLGEDEYPTPATPFFLEETGWVPIRPWSPFVLLPGWMIAEGELLLTASVALPSGRRMDMQRRNATIDMRRM